MSIGSISVLTEISADDLCWEGVTPDVVYCLFQTYRDDPNSASFLESLSDSAIHAPIALIKDFMGDDRGLSGESKRIPISQPTYVLDLKFILTRFMLADARESIIGIPRTFRIVHELLSFAHDEWWVRDFPCPLNPETMWMRALAWRFFRHAEYDDGRDDKVCKSSLSAGAFSTTSKKVVLESAPGPRELNVLPRPDEN